MNDPGAVGLYGGIRTTQHERVGLEAALGLVGTDGAADAWESVYMIEDKAERDRVKATWPVVITPHGIFEGRKNEAPVSWSGFTYHDLDGAFGSPAHPENNIARNRVLRLAQECPFIAAVGVSVGGRGLSVLIWQPGIDSHDAWQTAWDWAHWNLVQALPDVGGEWDQTARTPARAWFVPPDVHSGSFTPLPAPQEAHRPSPGPVVPQAPPGGPQQPQGNPLGILATQPPAPNDPGPTPEQWGARLGLRFRAGQWEGPCPLCGGNDRFFVTPGAVKAARVHCRKCGPFTPESYGRLHKVVWG